MSGPLPVPVSEIEAYCRLALIPARERMSFTHLIQQIDLAWLEVLDTVRSKPAVPQPKTGGPRKG